jgi:transposase InsO family protein
LKNERNGDVVRAIHSDNGSEFKNSRIKTFCRDLGLEHKFSSPYVACQNGVVERKIILELLVVSALFSRRVGLTS